MENDAQYKIIRGAVFPVYHNAEWKSGYFKLSYRRKKTKPSAWLVKLRMTACGDEQEVWFEISTSDRLARQHSVSAYVYDKRRLHLNSSLYTQVICDVKLNYNLYNSLMLPYLMYCTTAWAGGSPNRLKPIFLLQKRVIRIIAGVHYLAHSSPLFKSLNLLSIYDIYRHQLATLMYRHQSGLLPSIFKNFFTTNSDLHRYNTRKKHDYRSAISRIGARSSSVRIMGPKLWNSIDPSVRSALSLSSFKYIFKSLLVSQYS